MGWNYRMLSPLRIIGLENPVDLETWRVWFARVLVLMGAVLFPLGSLFSFPQHIAEGHFLLPPFNVAVWIVLLVRCFSKKDGYAVNAFVIMTLLYILTASYFVTLGPDHARPAWLVVCAVMAAIMFGIRGAVVATVLNAALLLMLFGILGPENGVWAAEYQAPYYRWLLFVINVSLLTMISSLPVGFMLNRLDRSLRYERDVQERLSEEGSRLKEANTALAREIELRRVTEKTLREREAYQRVLFEKAPDGYFIFDPDGRVVDINLAMEEMLDIRKEDVIGKRFYETGAVPAEDVSFAIDQVKRQIQGEELEPSEWNLRRKDGEFVTAEINSFPVMIQEKVHLFGIVRNVTRRKRAEHEKKELERRLVQAQKMEAIGTLAGGIAHDFNNILSAVIGYSDLALADTEKGTELEYHLNGVLKAGTRAKELVRQILTFSRQDSSPVFGPVQVKAVAEDVLKMMRATLPSTIEIRQHLESEASVLADAVQIYQVLMNLCTNAGHAMMEQGGVLEVRVSDVTPSADLQKKYPELGQGPHVEILVKDTGKGIPPEVLGRIFDPYFTTKGPGEGSGLGLSIVHGVIKNSDGVMNAQSEPMQGASFQIYLPAAGINMPVAGEQGAELPTGNEKILLVDDETVVADIGTMQLGKLGYSVDVCTSSAKALELFSRNPEEYDLVMTDMTMPEITGKELARKIMAIRADIPIILCTGFSHQIDQAEALQMGIKAFVMKPFNLREISRSVRKALDEAESRKALSEPAS